MARSRITGEQIVDEDVLSEDEHDSWVHRNLVCSGTVTFTDTPVMVSGSGDVYCKKLHAEEGSSSTVGYSGAIPIVTSVTAAGVVNNSYLIFEDGVMTTVSGGTPTQIMIPSGLLSIE